MVDNMEKIIICMGTNDRENIAKSHMGDTMMFYLYEISENNHISFLDKRENTVRNLDHAGKGKMNAILNIVKEADILVSNQKSPNFIKIAKNTRFQPIIVKEIELNKALKLLKENFSKILELVKERKEGNFSDFIPEI